MTTLCDGALSFLENAYDERRGLFSYSTKLKQGAYVHDFEHPAALRYTINSILGLQKAARQPSTAAFLGEVDEILDRFLVVNYGRIENHGDLGLLAVVLAESGHDDRLTSLATRLKGSASSPQASRLSLQDLSWMLWGSAAASRRGTPDAEASARMLFKLLSTRYLDRDSLLARHGLNRLRSDIVSFGATTYFLRALHEYARTFGDEYAETLFRWGVRRVLDLQGPRGEWPWMIAVRGAIPVDLYPVFTVHQDSMAMLFLLPALDDGEAEARGAIAKSIAWVKGHNELDAPMIVQRPYFVYRSVERKDALAKPRRYIRALVRTHLRLAASRARTERLRINRECRSYHLGWVLYVWSGRPDREMFGLGSPATDGLSKSG